MKEKILKYDPAEDLDSQEAIDIFLNDAFETGDHSYIAKAVGVVARAKGMSRVAKDTGLSREQLYKTLSGEGNPTLKTFVKIIKSLDIGLTAKHVEPPLKVLSN